MSLSMWQKATDRITEKTVPPACKAVERGTACDVSIVDFLCDCRRDRGNERVPHSAMGLYIFKVGQVT